MVRCKGLHAEIEKNGKESTQAIKEKIGTNSRKHCIMKIDDIEPNSMLIFLEFIYTGIVQNVRDFEAKTILDVFCLALKYDIKKLIDECEQYLCKNIDNDSAATILSKTYSLGYDAEKLKTMSYNYIIDNFGQVISTQDFLKLPKDLMGQIFAKASKLGVKVNSNNNIDSD